MSPQNVPQNVFAKTGCIVCNKFYDLPQLNGVSTTKWSDSMSADSYVLSQEYLLKLTAVSLDKSIFYNLPQLDGLILYRLIATAMNDYLKLLSSCGTQQWRSCEKSEHFNSRIFISEMILRSKHWVVVELCAVISISFVLKWRWALEPFSSYRSGLNKSCNEERIRKMALSLPHTFVFGCLPRCFWTSHLRFIVVLCKKSAIPDSHGHWHVYTSSFKDREWAPLSKSTDEICVCVAV